MNRFDRLAAINCSDNVEKKNGLSYLSWAWAWKMFKHEFPDSFYTIYENPEGLNYFHDNNTCWVKTGVTLVDGDFSLEHIEYLPIMDFRNRSIPREVVSSMDVNKTIQRSLTKAVARHGLGLYIYAGEDLPEEAPTAEDIKATPAAKKPEPIKAKVAATYICADCSQPITDWGDSKAEAIADKSKRKFGSTLCVSCAKKRMEEKK